MSAQPVTIPSQDIGSPVLDFQLTTITGENAALQTILRGRLGAVIVFWSGICSHCVRYDGYFNGFPWHHPELGMVAVASREKETVEQLRATALERRLTFPILYDSDRRVANQWFVQQTPRVFLVDSNRVLWYRGSIDNFKYPGEPDYVAYLEPAIKQFLAGEPVTRPETASFGCAIQSVYYHLPKTL